MSTVIKTNDFKIIKFYLKNTLYIETLHRVVLLQNFET
jgi:hypothetical protein